jgi:hypothetical protein
MALVAVLFVLVSALIIAKLVLFPWNPADPSSRWSTNQSLSHAILVVPLCLGFATLVGEFWVPTSRAALLRAEAALLAAQPHQALADVMILEHCNASGISYWRTKASKQNKPILVLLHGMCCPYGCISLRSSSADTAAAFVSA